MAGIEENRKLWNEAYDWPEGGDEWSEWCGGSARQWFGVLLPRIRAFVPTGTILEIAPGFGRWTQFLKDLCDHLVVVDLADRCIEHCKARFATAQNIEYYTNDGRSLEMIEDGSIDFVFSFDSLVHAENDVIESYVHQLSWKLKPDGVGFVHHSNAYGSRWRMALSRRLPHRWRAPLVTIGIAGDLHAGRSETGSAARFASLCEESGLSCVSQEKFTDGRGPYMIDCLSVFTPRGSRWDRPPITIRNPLFRYTATRLARVYPDPSRPHR